MHSALTFEPSRPKARIAGFLSDKDWVAQVNGVAKQRVASAASVEDVVQDACLEAIAREPELPADDAEAKKYILGIVRNKARMHARGADRRAEVALDLEQHAGNAHPPMEERDLWRRVVARVPAKRDAALVWFARVVFGDSLADISREEGVPYPTAQARHQRMRQKLRRIAIELTSAVTLVLLVLCGFRALRPREPYPTGTAPPVAEPPPAPLQQAAELRRSGLKACAERRWNDCLEALDRARAFDEAGDRAPEVQAARRRVAEAGR